MCLVASQDKPDLFHCLALLRQFLHLILDLLGEALAACVDAIVGEASSVSLCDQDVKGVFGREGGSQALCKIVQMRGASPESGMD